MFSRGVRAALQSSSLREGQSSLDAMESNARRSAFVRHTAAASGAAPKRQRVGLSVSTASNRQRRHVEANLSLEDVRKKKHAGGSAASRADPTVGEKKKRKEKKTKMLPKRKRKISSSSGRKDRVSTAAHGSCTALD